MQRRLSPRLVPPARRLLALACGLALLAVTLAPPASAAAEPVRVMPVGDSITAGEAGTPADTTYRWFLWHMVASAGRRVDFVGAFHGVGSRDQPPRRPDFDQDHNAVPGISADKMADRIEADSARHRPDVALVHLGTNDLRWDLDHGRTVEQSVARTLGDLRRLVASMRRARPGVAVVLARPISRRGYEAATEALGRGVDMLDDELSTPASPVLVADLNTGFDAARLTWDGVHPNEDGDRWMAERWATPLTRLLSGRGGYWLLGEDGAVHRFGTAADLGSVPVAPGDRAADIEATPDGRGWWAVTGRGAVTARGTASHHGEVAPGSMAPGEQAVSISTATADGYLVITSRGRALAFGDAVHRGDTAAVALNAPVVDAVASPTGGGYWMVAADGGVFTFGDARYHGSTGGKALAAPVGSLVPDPDGRGYWLGAADGGVFAFDAPFLGAMGGTPLNAPVTAMAARERGYLLVGADGGVFNFSGLPFVGSLGDRPPARPVVSVTSAS